jgi:cell wall-associated NlpC family hydrolase
MSRAVLLRSLVGKPYERGSDGPLAFDCYGLVRLVSRDVFGRELPGRDTMTALSHQRWRRVRFPEDGAIALMEIAGEKHIGIWLREGGVLHAVAPPGWKTGDRRPAVVFDALITLPMRGYSRPRFYVPR